MQQLRYYCNTYTSEKDENNYRNNITGRYDLNISSNSSQMNPFTIDCLH